MHSKIQRANLVAIITDLMLYTIKNHVVPLMYECFTVMLDWSDVGGCWVSPARVSKSPP